MGTMTVDSRDGSFYSAYALPGNPEKEIPGKFYFDTDFVVSDAMLNTCADVAGPISEILKVKRSDRSSFGGIMLICSPTFQALQLEQVALTFGDNLRTKLHMVEVAERKAETRGPSPAPNTRLQHAMATHYVPRSGSSN